MLEITITVDENDADYHTSVSRISQEDLDKILPLIEAIKNSDNNHGHNFPVGECFRKDLGEKSPEECYNQFDCAPPAVKD